MKTYKLSILVAATALFGCAENEQFEQITPESKDLQTFTATIETASRTSISNDNNVLWSADDKITVFAATTEVSEFTIKPEHVGQNSGTFTGVASTSGDALGCNIAYYPHSAATNYTSEESKHTLNVVLPAVQTYAAGTFGNGANAMAAITTDAATRSLNFKNLCGVLKLQLKGTDKIARIVLSDNGGSKLAGAASVTFDGSGIPVVTMKDSAAAKITLDCGAEGVQLNETTATDFWIALPPTNFATGFTVRIVATDGRHTDKTTSRPVNIARNSIQPMTEFTVVFDQEPVPADQIRYTSTDVIDFDTYADFGANVTSNNYDYDTRTGIITFDGDITSIGWGAFSDCYNLTSVTIPNGVTSIGDNAFYNCTNLASITIPNSVTSIGNEAFYNCTNLTSITIPNGVTSIGESAFIYCSALTSITIPGSVVSIDDSAFGCCNNLTAFYGKFATVDNRCLIINNHLVAFAPVGLTAYSISAGVTSIGGDALNGCTALTSITIPSSVTSIGDNAFYRCTALGSITIPDDVTTIGGWAFSRCTSLTSITIPSKVISISYNAFLNCTSLASVYCKPTKVPAGGSNMFDNNASGRKIYVPMDSVGDYKTTRYWSDYAADIVGYDF